jgi:hypothetical protein
MSVILTPDGQNLTITLTPNDNAYLGVAATYTVFWLDPSIFGQQDIYGNGLFQTTNSLSITQGRRKVTDLQGGAGIVSTVVPYLPYVTGGWMYATVVPVGSSKEYLLSGTNFVSIPVLGASGEPLLAEVPTNINLTFDNSSVPGFVRVEVAWTNPATLTTVAYMKIATVGYKKDGFYEEWATFRLNTRAGAKQGSAVSGASTTTDTSQSFVLEHNTSLAPVTTTFYFIPVSPALTPLRLGSCPAVGVSAF